MDDISLCGGAEIVRQLAPRLRPHYLVLPVERFVIDTLDDIIITTNIYPNVGVAKSAREMPSVYAPTATESPLYLATDIPEGYDLAIHYARSPEPALEGVTSAIADSLLRVAGLHPA